MASGKEETSNRKWKEKGLARASAKLLSEGQKATNARKSVKSYKDLLVWQKGISLVKKIYQLTQRFPVTERFGLVSQMRRAAVSIPSNIAEGQARHTRKEFIQFLSHSEGSVAELETQVILGVELGYCALADTHEITGLTTELSKMLDSLRRKLEASQ